MILQELYQLYERLVASGVDMPQMGTSVQKVTFCVELSPEGGCTFRDLRQCVESPPDKKGKTKKKLVATEMMVLGGDKKTGKGLNPCFLSNSVDYMLGCIACKEKDEKKKKARNQFNEARRRYLNLRGAGLGPEFEALCRFYERWEPPATLEELPCESSVLEAMTKGRGVFRIQGQMQYLHEIPSIRKWWIQHGEELWMGIEKKTSEMMCLVTGQEGPIARLHSPQISGVRNSHPTGATLVSFNCDSFKSYGKEQGSNSPVSEVAAFGYCNALNYLLRSSNQRFQLGDATTVYWTDAPSMGWEQIIAASFSETPQAQDNALLKKVGEILKLIASGCPTPPPEAGEVRFFLLGLSAPSKARLNICFFQTGTMGDYITRLAAHLDALRLQPRDAKFKDPEIILPWMILRETVRDPKDNIPSTYIEPLMRAILLGRPYPDSLAMAMLRRMKYRQKDKNHKGSDRVIESVNYIRCAYIKAWLTRRNSSYKLTPMLDETNTQVGYVLGRLFALLQRTQDKAQRDLNRTIRDAFYASASTSPAYVFPRLLKLYRHHVVKLDAGLRITHEKELQAIMALLENFPAHLNIEQQGLFALGFYHQTQAFFTKKNNPDNQ